MAAFRRLRLVDAQEGSRGRIVEYLRQAPGASFLEIHAALRIAGYGALDYHLAVLARFRLVEGFRVGRVRRYYLASGLRENGNRAHAFATHPAFERLAALVRESPGLSQTEYARLCLPKSRQAVTYELGRLAQAGVVLRARVAGRVRYWATCLPSLGQDAARAVPPFASGQPPVARQTWLPQAV